MSEVRVLHEGDFLAKELAQGRRASWSAQPLAEP